MSFNTEAVEGLIRQELSTRKIEELEVFERAIPIIVERARSEVGNLDVFVKTEVGKLVEIAGFLKEELKEKWTEVKTRIATVIGETLQQIYRLEELAEFAPKPTSPVSVISLQDLVKRKVAQLLQPKQSPAQLNIKRKAVRREVPKPEYEQYAALMRTLRATPIAPEDFDKNENLWRRLWEIAGRRITIGREILNTQSGVKFRILEVTPLCETIALNLKTKKRVTIKNLGGYAVIPM